MSIQEKVSLLRAAIKERSPYCSGTLPISAEEFILYYGQNATTTGRIDLSNCSDDQLKHLASVCDAATFGMNQEDVLDESYRKAWKLDANHFSSKFNLEKSHLVDIVRGELLEGEDENQGIEAELYKLNVYGQESFFKAHKDIPRADNMFGSLVTVFPTPHVGGALILRHNEKEWVFDSAKAVVEQKKPSIAYIAFYSDVEHEVTTVESGYRVTLTYNLYFSAPQSKLKVPAVPIKSPDELALKSAFSALLEDATFMPEGGNLAFGLLHQYPVSPTTSVEAIKNFLKGSDAMVNRVCSQLSLHVSVRVVYQTSSKWDRTRVVLNRVLDLSRHEVEEPVSLALQSTFKGKYLKSVGEDLSKNIYIHDYDESEVEEVQWVTDLTKFTHVSTSVMAYGNQSSIEHLYGDAFLIARIGKAEKRDTEEEWAASTAKRKSLEKEMRAKRAKKAAAAKNVLVAPHVQAQEFSHKLVSKLSQCFLRASISALLVTIPLLGQSVINISINSLLPVDMCIEDLFDLIY